MERVKILVRPEFAGKANRQETNAELVTLDRL